MTEVPSRHPSSTMDLKLTDDTICALATPVGEGGIGIIKISGSKALATAQRLFQPAHATFPLESHHLHYGWIRDPASDQIVDEVLLSYMAAPRTYTCEDVVEVNCHSGYAVLNRILMLVIEAGARLAEPGEFTRRAFLNGRLDLSQAEAVIEVIRSSTEQSLVVANRLLRGELSQKVRAWRETILGLQAALEASMDFSEDLEDEPCNVTRLVASLDEGLLHPLQDALKGYQEARILREGFTIVLVGKPNVGKSSLLNALLKKDRAIVTPFPGTTRDIVEDSFILSGILVRVLDTAGIRHQPDAIESLGIERTFQSVEKADVVLWLLDASRPLTREDDAVFSRIVSKRYIMILNKADLPAEVSPREVREHFGEGAPIRALSVLNPHDVESLSEYLTEAFLQNPLARGRSMMIPNLRHKACLQQSLEALQAARELLRQGSFGELVSLELSTARQALDMILGLTPDDGLLDRIFSEFCIGK
jgi:tRNA modification GTPase